MNPYFVAFCNDTGATKDNFKALEYLKWIDDKHSEFQRIYGFTYLQSHLIDYQSKFCEFLGVERKRLCGEG